MSLSLAGALTVTGGKPLGALPPRLRVSIDSRTIAPGETFLALRGPSFDGHAFVAQAFTKGAAAAIVADAAIVPSGRPAIVVDDTSKALEALAATARSESAVRIAGITGSAGKTTTKAFLHQLLCATLDRASLATPANENNEIGVAKTLLLLEPQTRFAVIEMGCRHFGDLVPLVAMARPEFGIVTNIGDAHLEIMGSRARLIETKFGLFDRGARPILNALDPDSREWVKRTGLDALWFAAIDDGTTVNVPGPLIVLRADRAIELTERGRTSEFGALCNVPGRHNRANAAAAVAAAWALGADLAAIAAELATLTLPPGRYERERIGAFDVIYDAYNASMSGTLATLSAFAQERATRRIAVLGSMAELGEDAPSMHRRVGAAAYTAGVDTILVGGDFADELAAGAREAGCARDRVVRFAHNTDAVSWLRAHGAAGDVVLLKASRRYRLEEIVEGLRAS